MEKIKLVIWDLDETFWNGTLSDGAITPIQENIDLIKSLTDRGIMNSICSKNDFDKTKSTLEELGVWEYFVFPSIDWTPKGGRVKHIIETMNLRAVNCIFVDDNINNLKEAEYTTSGLQTALPEDLKKLLSDPAFEGKDDREHSRLKQYRVLEQKTIAREKSNSNEEFLFESNIHVEIQEDCSDMLDRIHEMIHRNNQLNFTKDRISIEEVRQLFMDPEVKSGYVHVYDKFGDHGIVGCFAVKDGIAKQLVFSCRILGMGVEQYVYAWLGFPQITIVGEVAGELKQNEMPAWINQENSEDVETNTEVVNEDTPQLIIYGACALRPIWAYIAPSLSNVKFADVFRSPATCNLAVGLRESEEQLKDWVSKVGTLDPEYTFYSDIVEGNYDYLLVSLVHDLSNYVYTNKKTGSYFYSVKLKDNFLIKDIEENYDCRKVTLEDIDKEVRYLASSIPEGKTILILTLPEVIFPNLGEDEDYLNRIELNKIVEKISEDNDNVKLIDMRKYAKEPLDFKDTVVNHYNREIGFAISREVILSMGIKKSTKKTQKNDENIWKKGAQIVKSNDEKIPVNVVQNICNGKYHLEIECDDNLGYKFDISVVKDNGVVFSKSNTQSKSFCLNATKTGEWHAKVKILGDDTLLIKTPKMKYTAFNYALYSNPEESQYDDYIGTVGTFVAENETYEKRENDIISKVALLAAKGVNVAKYFKDKKINEISLITNKKIGEVLIPFLVEAGIKIKHIYSFQKFKISDLFVNNIPKVEDISKIEKLAMGDNVLLAYNYLDSSKLNSVLRKGNVNMHWIFPVLEELMTQEFFREYFAGKKNPARVMVMRCPRIKMYYSLSYEYYTPGEKNIFSMVEKSGKSNETLMEFARNEMEKYYGNVSEKMIQDVIYKPHFSNNSQDTQILDDYSGEYVNIENGMRRTIGNPQEYEGRILIYGSSLAYGYGVTDEHTIASYLQSLVGNKYKVCNCSNIWKPQEFDKMLQAIQKTDCSDKDVIIILLDDYRIERSENRAHWLNWKGIHKPVEKIDLFSLFKVNGRQDLFVFPDGYNAVCNKAIAQEIFDNIENI